MKNKLKIGSAPAIIQPDLDYVRPEIPRITHEELKQMMDGGSNPVIIDTRDESKFKQGHLAGAINIPYAVGIGRTQDSMDGKLRALLDDKLKVFYCD
jgi:rhodanese-related sulfurtransferase